MPKKATDDSGPISNLGHFPRRPDKDESGHKTKFDGREQQTLKVGRYVFDMSLKCVFFFRRSLRRRGVPKYLGG